MYSPDAVAPIDWACEIHCPGRNALVVLDYVVNDVYSIQHSHSFMLLSLHSTDGVFTSPKMSRILVSNSKVMSEDYMSLVSCIIHTYQHSDEQSCPTTIPRLVQSDSTLLLVLVHEAFRSPHAGTV